MYDLQKDPSEMNNLIDEKKYQKEILKLKSELLQLIKKYDDKEAEEISNQPLEGK